MMLYKHRSDYIVWDARRQRLYTTAMAMCVSAGKFGPASSQGSMGYILTHCGIDGYA